MGAVLLFFPGIQGFLSHIDNNGNAEGNYTVLARLPYDMYNYDYNYSMRPAGHFQIDQGSELPVNNQIFSGTL